MKRLLCLWAFALAFVGNAMAYEPVIKETHWFGFYEYEEPWLKTETGIHYGWDENKYLLSLKGAFRYDDDDQDNVDWNNEKWCTTTYYSVLDHKPRFSVDDTDAWKVGRLAEHWAYKSYGLQNTREYATNFTIHDLEVGDTIIFEYYRENGDADGQVTLAGGSLQNINNGQSIYGTNEYVCNAQGNITFSCPKHMLLRSVTIKLAEYEAAETEITEIAESERANYEGATGYRFTIKSAGVLEDRRCAVPYMTMRIGDAENNNDLVYVRNLGTANEYGEQFGAGCIISDKDDLDVSKLSNHYAQLNNGDGQAITNLMLPGKEWTVFKAERAPEGYTGGTWDGDTFNSIYPIYGTYYYFFPEVDGYLNVRFYCEGNREHAPLWYKQNGDEFISPEDQPTLIYTNSSNGDNTCYTGWYEDQNYYEYRVKVEKGGVYYLCSNPTLLHQQRPTVRLMSYAFMPLFRLDPLWYVANDTEKTNHAITNAAELNQDFTVNGTHNIIHDVKCLGNIHSAEPYFVTEGNKAKLCFKNIVYKSEYLNDPTLNDGGAVVVHVECEEGKAKFVLTIPYSAEKAVMSADTNDNPLRVMDTNATRNPNGKQVKKWDFFSNIYEVGQYSDPSSQLYNEIHKADGGLTADWVETYANIEEGKEPIFKSVYDMEGDNADMLHETEGLVFFTDANVLGIYNENNPSTITFADRYIGFMDDGELWVPNLKEGDRVVIKMGCFGNAEIQDESQNGTQNQVEPEIATLNFENAKDALGNAISGDYKIGGSQIKDVEGNDKAIPCGEYHFIATGGHFKLKVKEAELLKIYSIVIYKNSITPENILTENEVKGDLEKRYILNIQESDVADNVNLHLQYRGIDEPTKYHEKTRKTGNIAATDIVESADNNDGNNVWYTYTVAHPETPAEAKFGIFKVRLGVKTTDEIYVTDYADCMIPVGYRQTMEYPYTWDFTDLKKYVSAGIDTDGTEKDVDEADLKIWDEYDFRTNSDEYDGYIFAPGGQLYGGTTMFDETRGIGIFHNEIDNKSMTMNGSADAADGGLEVAEEYGFVVPQVAAGQAVYVHATAGDGATAQYAIGNGAKQTLKKVGTDAYAMKMADDATTANVTLYFKGCEVNKIAVSEYAKTVNKLGFASESRNVEIDPELMGYMTGTGLKAYTITEVNYGTKAGDIPSITLTAVPETNVIAPATTGDGNAYIIYNTDDAKAVSALDGGFHLFVPDMHDKSTATGGKTQLDGNDNFLKSWYPEGSESSVDIDQEDGDYTNYLMNYKYKDARGNSKEGPEAFYRAGAGAKLGGNKAYLQLLTSNVKPITANAGAKFVIFFVDEEEGTETTAIDGVQTTESISGDNSIYTLSGMKVNQPQKGSIYVKNGKKVILK